MATSVIGEPILFSNTTATQGVPHDQTTCVFVDDFVVGSTSSGSVGLGWAFSGALTYQPGVADHPGIVGLNTTATTNTHGWLISTGNSTQAVLVPTDTFDMVWVFKMTQTDADTRARIGLSSDVSTNTPVNGIYIEKILTDTQWFGVTRASSTETRTAALATVDTGWHRVRIRRVDASTIGFTFDAGTEVTLTATIPTAGLKVFCHIFNGVGVTKLMEVDYFRLIMTGLAR